MTDDLIARLSAELKPVPRGALALRLALASLVGLALAIPLMLNWLGLRPDMPLAATTPIFWIKFAYTGGLGLIGLWAIERLSRPAVPGRRPILLAGTVFALLVAAAVIDYLLAPPEARQAIVMGSSALLCPFYIMALSLPLLAVNLLVMRRLAPTSPALAGLAAGLMAGGLGAWIYSFHCTEQALPFLSIWYSAGIAAIALLGALAGRFLLRW